MIRNGLLHLRHHRANISTKELCTLRKAPGTAVVLSNFIKQVTNFIEQIYEPNRGNAHKFHKGDKQNLTTEVFKDPSGLFISTWISIRPKPKLWIMFAPVL